MNCPYCGAEMEQGFLYGGGDALLWSAREKRNGFLDCPKEGEVLLSTKTFPRTQVTACRCRACGKIILDDTDESRR